MREMGKLRTAGSPDRTQTSGNQRRHLNELLILRLWVETSGEAASWSWKELCAGSGVLASWPQILALSFTSF